MHIQYNVVSGCGRKGCGFVRNTQKESTQYPSLMWSRLQSYAAVIVWPHNISYSNFLCCCFSDHISPSNITMTKYSVVLQSVPPLQYYGGLRVVTTFAVGGKQALENYVRNIVTSQLKIVPNPKPM